MATIKKMLVTARDKEGNIIGIDEEKDIPLSEVASYLLKGLENDVRATPDTKLITIVLEFD